MNLEKDKYIIVEVIPTHSKADKGTIAQISALKLEGLKKHISTHAAGVVISSVPIDDVIPIHYNGT